MKDYKAIIGELLEAFKFPDALDNMARTAIKRADGDKGVPCRRWSFLNQVFCWAANTEDARGIRQWNAVGRRVKKGSHAFGILAPRMVRDKTGERLPDGSLPLVRAGFIVVPVFRVEDTEGAEMPRYDYSPAKMPPLMSVAERFGIKVNYAPKDGADYWGYYAGGRGEIRLCTDDARVFFHELAHAAHERVKGKPLSGGQVPEHEIVAEMSAAVLARIYGGALSGERTAYEYIKHYAGEGDITRACLSVMSEVDKTVALILGSDVASGQPSAIGAES